MPDTHHAAFPQPDDPRDEGPREPPGPMPRRDPHWHLTPEQARRLLDAVDLPGDPAFKPFPPTPEDA